MRRGVVVGEDPLVVEVEGERRRAWADTALVGEVRNGDEVIVNVEARDLGLGSGGFDVVHANLTRGLAGESPVDHHVMKLNYTSLQHAVEPVEGPDESGTPSARPPVLVIPLHGHLAPAVWAARAERRDLQVGYVQTHGGALPGAVSELRERGLLAGHVTAGPSYGADHEAISLVGGLDAAAAVLGWDAVIAGPGPGILGSATRFGHGGMAALDTAHAALALGSPTLVGPRLSSGDARDRHLGLSHHTRSVLELLLAPVRVPVPEVDTDLWPTTQAGPGAYDELLGVCRDRHDLAVEEVDLDGYAASGLPTRTMGRELGDDALFFAAPLASGRALAKAVSG
jgi:hypothetical protein